MKVAVVDGIGVTFHSVFAAAMASATILGVDAVVVAFAAGALDVAALDVAAVVGAAVVGAVAVGGKSAGFGARLRGLLSQVRCRCRDLFPNSIDCFQGLCPHPLSKNDPNLMYDSPCNPVVESWKQFKILESQIIFV